MRKFTDWLKIAFYATIAGTILIMWLVQPVWVARLSALTYSSWLFTAITIVWGCNPKSEFLYANSKIARIGSERTKRVTGIILRIAVLLAALFLLSRSILISFDVFLVANNGIKILIPIKGKVLGNSYTLGMYIISQGLLVRQTGEKYGESYTLFFCPTRIDQGETHRFLIAPNSKLILKVEGD